ncbi:dTDP-4-dehydrorhamnose 3,5-epimerase family protein [Nocardia brasiliensis]|uniref:dTDP-4-dehydrorhamnose 3,5-epimerase family protein n=1 Tax=Nocardia brasiliensis TaxID=37326 RepID=UPI002458FA42|nr:dTDP-4-dehydrorhamnose 3,5-epimerase [Nocardia brasiliensis]
MPHRDGDTAAPDAGPRGTARPATIIATALGLPDVYLLRSRRFPDERGHFQELSRTDVLAEITGYPVRLEQVNISVSHRGVIRGIHVVASAPGQSKLVTCVRGSIIDIAVDLRVGSPTFGQFELVALDERMAAGVYLGPGVGHAFVATAEDTRVLYQCSTLYTPGSELAVNVLDPALGLPLTTGFEPILSENDRGAATLAELLDQDLLPHYRPR